MVFVTLFGDRGLLVCGEAEVGCLKLQKRKDLEGKSRPHSFTILQHNEICKSEPFHYLNRFLSE